MALIIQHIEIKDENQTGNKLMLVFADHAHLGMKCFLINWQKC